MKRFLSNLTSAPMRLQIVALLIFTQVAAQFVTMGLANGVLYYTGNGRGGVAAQSVSAFVTVLRIADQFDDALGEHILRAAVKTDKQFRIEQQLPASVDQPKSTLALEYGQALREIIPDSWQSRTVAYFVADGWSFLPAGQTLGAAARLPDGGWLVYEQSSVNTWRLLPTVLLALTVTVLALPLLFLSVWSGSALVAPIAALASGAERFSRDLEAPGIKERGAKEVRAVARAMNDMRGRIRKLVADRSQTLAAIAHDIRTPLTRLRLRAETVDDVGVREQILDELDGIDRMVNSALSFMRSQRDEVVPVRTDLAILAHTIVDEFADQGKDVRYEGEPRLIIECDADLVRRAIENLVGNAVSHAGSAVVSLHHNDEHFVEIAVSDHGPGLPVADHQNVVEPFHKGNGARSHSDKNPGFGLGLSITRNIAAAHGGTLSLSENRPNGLTAKLTLPVTFKRAGEYTRVPHHAV